MRDLIKDAKYYEKYLAQNMKRITRFQEQLKTLNIHFEEAYYIWFYRGKWNLF